MIVDKGVAYKFCDGVIKADSEIFMINYYGKSLADFFESLICFIACHIKLKQICKVLKKFTEGHAKKQSYNRVNFADVTNEFGFEFQKMSLATDNICFASTGDFDSLKVLVAKDLELSGIWEHPGGDKKVFKFNNSSISWRKSKSLLQLEGDEVGTVIQRLCVKILKSSHSATVIIPIFHARQSTRPRCLALAIAIAPQMFARILRNLSLIMQLIEKLYDRCRTLSFKSLELYNNFVKILTKFV